MRNPNPSTLNPQQAMDSPTPTGGLSYLGIVDEGLGKSSSPILKELTSTPIHPRTNLNIQQVMGSATPTGGPSYSNARPLSTGGFLTLLFFFITLEPGVE